MKVRRSFRKSPRARAQSRWQRPERRRAYKATRRLASTVTEFKRDMVTLTLFIDLALQARRQKKFERYMRTRSYRKRVDHILAEAKRIRGRIIHDSRSPFGRVVPRI